VIKAFGGQSLPWKPVTNDLRTQIERFLFPLMESIQTQEPDHDTRVQQKILQLWNAHSPQTLPL
jgi:hypothetical protein